jgi:hypothetical protein
MVVACGGHFRGLSHSMFDVRCSPFFWPSTTILAGGSSAYGGGLWRPFSRQPRGALSIVAFSEVGPVHHSPALRDDGGSFTRPAAWPRGAALRGLTARFFFSPGFFRVPFWLKSG